MKILVISQYWQPENGVPQRRWSWLTEVLTKQGHEVMVIAPPPHYDRQVTIKQWLKYRKGIDQKPAEIGASGERIIRSGFLPAGTSLTARALNQAAVALGSFWVVARRPAELREFTPDVIFGTVPALPTAAVTWCAGRRFGCPYVIDLRDAWPDLLKQSGHWNTGTGKASVRQRVLSKGPLQLVTWATQRVLYRALKDASAITATSSELAENLSQRQQIKTNGQTPPIHTLRNVFPNATHCEEALVDQRQNELHVLYAGTIGRAQDLQNAVHAVEIASKRGVPVRLQFVGSGATKAELQKLAQPLGNQVSFEPRHPADSLEDYYQWADTALVHLADWEPLTRTVPSKLYELMEAKIHISAVVSGEAANLVNDLSAGHVVAPSSPTELADLWQKLYQDRSLLSVSDEGNNWVQNQRGKVAPEILAEVLNEVAKQHD